MKLKELAGSAGRTIEDILPSRHPDGFKRAGAVRGALLFLVGILSAAHPALSLSEEADLSYSSFHKPPDSGIDTADMVQTQMALYQCQEVPEDERWADHSSFEKEWKELGENLNALNVLAGYLGFYLARPDLPNHYEYRDYDYVIGYKGHYHKLKLKIDHEDKEAQAKAKLAWQTLESTKNLGYLSALNDGSVITKDLFFLLEEIFKRGRVPRKDDKKFFSYNYSQRTLEAFNIIRGYLLEKQRSLPSKYNCEETTEYYGDVLIANHSKVQTSIDNLAAALGLEKQGDNWERSAEQNKINDKNQQADLEILKIMEDGFYSAPDENGEEQVEDKRKKKSVTDLIFIGINDVNSLTESDWKTVVDFFTLVQLYLDLEGN